MFGFSKEMAREIERMRNLRGYLMEKHESAVEGRPAGSLLLRQGRNSISVSLQKETRSEDGKRRRTSETLGSLLSKEALSFAQDEYIAKLSAILNVNLNTLMSTDKRIQPYDIETILSLISPASKAILTASGDYSFLQGSETSGKRIILPDEYANSWPIKSPSRTASGKIVRSKGEAMIGLALEYYGITYGVEQRLELIDEDGYRVSRFPDFTIHGRRWKIYWEHFGMIEDDNYLINSAKKIQLYHRNGIVLWDNLIVTMDLRGGGINAETIDRIIREFILPQMG